METTAQSRHSLTDKHGCSCSDFHPGALEVEEVGQNQTVQHLRVALHLQDATQNHTAGRAGREFWRSSSPNPPTGRPLGHQASRLAHSQLLVNHYSTTGQPLVDHSTLGQPLANCWPIAVQPLVNLGSTMGQPLVNNSSPIIFWISSSTSGQPLVNHSITG